MAETVTVVAALDGRSRVAVTVLLPPFSPIEGGVRTRVTAGGPSSSAMVPVAAASASVAPDSFESVTVRVSLGSSASSPVTVTSMVLLSSPVSNVRVPFAAV